MKIEWMIIFEGQRSGWRSRNDFLNLLNSHFALTVDHNNIRLVDVEGNTVADAWLEVKEGRVASKNEGVFYVSITDPQDNCDKLTLLTNEIRRVAESISKEKTEIHTLWDDVGRHYAVEAYPWIRDVENALRRLIQRFMLKNLGSGWQSSALSQSDKNNFERRRQGDDWTVDYPSYLNFNHLPDILFNSYRANESRLENILAKGQFSDNEIEELKTLAKRSNWERYFVDAVPKKADGLNKQWQKLYQLRNQLAHSRSISKQEFAEIKGICKELIEVFDKASDEASSVNLLPVDIAALSRFVRRQWREGEYDRTDEKIVLNWFLNSYAHCQVVRLEHTPYPPDTYLVIVEDEPTFTVTVNTTQAPIVPMVEQSQQWVMESGSESQKAEFENAAAIASYNYQLAATELLESNAFKEYPHLVAYNHILLIDNRKEFDYLSDSELVQQLTTTQLAIAVQEIVDSWAVPDEAVLWIGYITSDNKFSGALFQATLNELRPEECR